MVEELTKAKNGLKFAKESDFILLGEKFKNAFQNSNIHSSSKFIIL